MVNLFQLYCFRTDFYLITEGPNTTVGLPEGLAENLIKHTFYKWKPKSDVYNGHDIPIVSEEIVVESSVEHSDSDIQNEEDVRTEVSDVDIYSDFAKSESYNGGNFKNYCWSQTITDIYITLRLPINFTRKDIIVEIASSKVSVTLRDGTVLLDGELCQKCKAGDAIWSLDRQKLQIHIDKCQEMWWNCLVKSEPQLDLSKIDCSRPYEELSDEAQAKIEELQWNQDRKRLGLPTSDEMVLQNALKKAWNVEGSPFSGPFDPSLVTFN